MQTFDCVLTHNHVCGSLISSSNLYLKELRGGQDLDSSPGKRNSV